MRAETLPLRQEAAVLNGITLALPRGMRTIDNPNAASPVLAHPFARVIVALSIVAAPASIPFFAKQPTYGTGTSRTPSNITGVTGGGASPSTSGGVSVATHGAMGNCSADDTSAFRNAASAAASANVPLVVPAPSGACYKLTGTVHIGTSVIGVGYPLVKVFSANGTISYDMFDVDNYTGSGLWITGLRLEGSWDPTGQDANGRENGTGIGLYSSRNITIQDNLIQNNEGDNIYLGTGSAGANQNILITNNTLLNPFRCAVALINAGTQSSPASGVIVMNNVITKLNSFVGSIDFEPNNPSTEAVWNTEVAYNNITIPPSMRPAGLSNEINWAVTLTNSTGRGGNIYLHDNFGSFGSIQEGGSGGPGFLYTGNLGANYAPWINVHVSNNVSGGQPSTAPQAPTNLRIIP